MKFARPNNNQSITHYLPVCYFLRIQQYPVNTTYNIVNFWFVTDGNLDAIYDVTIAYPDNLPETEGDLSRGKLPKEVHFYIKR